MVIWFPVEPRVGFVSENGVFIGFAVPFGTKGRASYVVFTATGWRAVATDYRSAA